MLRPTPSYRGPWEWQGPNADSRLSQQGINTMQSCQWRGYHRCDGPTGNPGPCRDCGCDGRTAILSTVERRQHEARRAA